MNARTELGTDTELLELVAKVRAFSHDTATIDEQGALARALRIIADDTIARWESARAREQELERKLSVLSVAGELAGVLGAIKPPKKGWFSRWRNPRR